MMLFEFACPNEMHVVYVLLVTYNNSPNGNLLAKYKIDVY
jgi:hypothetical protein